MKVNEDAKKIAAFLQQGSVAVPAALLKHYSTIGLNETETMLLLHLIAFRSTEQNTFPTIEQLQSRMNVSPEVTVSCLERLLSQNYLAIDEHIDRETGIRSECYNLQPLYERLAAMLLNGAADGEEQVAAGVALDSKAASESDNMFTIFEKEFGRPLSPMECEMISAWIDQDQYAEELIKAALKEAVFAGKVHFRYIDRILLDWSRNRIRTEQEAREYAKQFRGKE